MKKEQTEVVKKNHTLQIENCQKGVLTGVLKVISSNESSLMLETGAGGLQIAGSGLKINKFDAGEGVLTFEGTVAVFRYSAAKKPFLKRLFQ